MPSDEEGQAIATSQRSAEGTPVKKASSPKKLKKATKKTPKSAAAPVTLQSDATSARTASPSPAGQAQAPVQDTSSASALPVNTVTIGRASRQPAFDDNAVDSLARTANRQLLNQLLLAGESESLRSPASSPGSPLFELGGTRTAGQRPSVDAFGGDDVLLEGRAEGVRHTLPPLTAADRAKAVLQQQKALEEQLGPVIKTLYANGKQHTFIKQLETFIKEKEGDIERLCNYHYQDFVSSVDHLLQFRNDTQVLKNNIVDYNKEVQETSSGILTQRQDFVQLTTLSRNLQDAVTMLKECHQTMQVVQKAKRHIVNRKCYHAIRVLEDLEFVYLPPLQDLQFIQYIKACLPSFRMQIRTAVSQEMTNWFVSVRSKTPRIGRMVLEYTSTMLAPALARIRTMRTGSIVTIAPHLLEEASRHTSQSSLEEGDHPASLDELDVCDPQVSELDFRPLYQGLHIFSTLNVRSEFSDNFERNRNAQANLVLSPSFPLHSAAADLAKLEAFLHEIVGFFVVEYIVMQTTVNFRSKNVVDALWDTAVEKLLAQLNQGLRGCNDVTLYTTIKALLIGFMHCMEYYQYSGHRLMELLTTLSSKYAELITLHTTAACLKSVVDNDSASITISTEEAASRLRKLCPWAVTKESTAYRLILLIGSTCDSIGNRSLPTTVTFSNLVPDLMMSVKDLIRGVQHFTSGFSAYHTETDELLRTTLEHLFIKTIIPAMSKRSSSASLSQIARLVIDIIHLTDGLDVIEAWIGGQGAHTGDNVKVRKVVLGQTRQAMTDLSQASEKRVFVLCNEKINGFIDCAEYNYEPTELQKGPSPYLVDLIDFLKTVWHITLVDLPLHVRSFLYYESIFHVCEVLMKLFVGPQIKRISPLFFINFNLDLMFIEQFVASLNQPNLEDLLVELRQLETLCTTETPEEYMDKEIRMRKYSRLEKCDVVAILEKMKELSVLGTLADAFTQMPGTQILSLGAVSQKQLQKSEQAKAKRKSLEAMLKTLRRDMEHEKPSSRGRDS